MQNQTDLPPARPLAITQYGKGVRSVWFMSRFSYRDLRANRIQLFLTPFGLPGANL